MSDQFSHLSLEEIHSDLSDLIWLIEKLEKKELEFRAVNSFKAIVSADYLKQWIAEKREHVEALKGILTQREIPQ